MGYVIHCTKKLLDRIKPELTAGGDCTTRLGNWYATALMWRPQVSLFVNERTLIPVLIPLAPAATLAQRFPRHLAQVLAAHGIATSFIEAELEQMKTVVYAKTANRSVVGIMNEFAFLADGYKHYMETEDLVALSLKLALTPLFASRKDAHWPDKALQGLVAGGPMQ
jgi:hypothetical protein